MRYPRVILIGGAPMAGKTTVAQRIAAQLGYDATWGAPLVIEGWSLWPERVSQLGLSSVHALWLVAHANTLQDRLGKAEAFYRGASDEGAMRHQYLARSLWYNTRLQETVTALGLSSIAVPLRAPVRVIVEMCLEQLRR
jgi:2-phosphoglycerate kinase